MLLITIDPLVAGNSLCGETAKLCATSVCSVRFNPFIPINLEPLSHLWIHDYPVYRPFLTACQINYSPVNSELDHKGLETLVANRSETALKSASDFRYIAQCPAKVSGDLNMSNCFLLPHILGNSLTISLIKKD